MAPLSLGPAPFPLLLQFASLERLGLSVVFGLLTDRRPFSVGRRRRGSAAAFPLPLAWGVLQGVQTNHP